MAQCKAMGHPMGGRQDEQCPYEGLWDGECYFHNKVTAGLIVLDSDHRKRRPVQRQRRELDVLLEEWG